MWTFLREFASISFQVLLFEYPASNALQYIFSFVAYAFTLPFDHCPNNQLASLLWNSYGLTSLLSSALI